ncbi:hypothetical protein [Deinococcus murrayi]|uniref:hypothetical protein n=1 Tax=Deinococcus murrayi TaxID=68910 RepID=UPI000488AC28|nr:hypothetical protein [Deinococcus murrayi]
MTFAGEVTPLYALALALVAAYWLGRVGREARGRHLPRVAWWAVPGWGALLLAPLLEVPALFGLGAAALLLAEYWPGAYRPARSRPGGAWPLVGVLLGLALLALLAAPGGGRPADTAAALAAALGLLLAGAGGLLARALFRARPAAPRLGLEVRFGPVQVPPWPDLSLALTGSGAQLTNVSDGPLWLAGWSPSGTNAWLRVRDEGGVPLNVLPRGGHAYLPLRGWERGVRVWYRREPGPGPSQLFRADWTPPGGGERVLN